jgi:hypothetical protein
MHWWYTHSGSRARTSGMQLFPERPKGYVAATRALANYAANKSTAMRCRAKGEVQTAIMYEEICERIYKHLPEFARW